MLSMTAKDWIILFRKMKKISEVFNPKKITISGKSKIVDTDEGRFVIKKKSKDIKSLYDYLNSTQN